MAGGRSWYAAPLVKVITFLADGHSVGKQVHCLGALWRKPRSTRPTSNSGDNPLESPAWSPAAELCWAGEHSRGGRGLQARWCAALAQPEHGKGHSLPAVFVACALPGSWQRSGCSPCSCDAPLGACQSGKTCSMPAAPWAPSRAARRAGCCANRRHLRICAPRSCRSTRATALARLHHRGTARGAGGACEWRWMSTKVRARRT